jgi:putative transposase
MDDFSVYIRRLPHWRQRNAIYFVTWRLYKLQAPLSPDERTTIVNALAFFNHDRYVLLCYVVMDDHIHVMLRPITHNLSQIMHTWKSFTANRLHLEFERERHVWQDESFDRVIRNQDELINTMKYIYDNPKKRWPEVEIYDWVKIFDDWD